MGYCLELDPKVVEERTFGLEEVKNSQVIVEGNVTCQNEYFSQEIVFGHSDLQLDTI